MNSDPFSADISSFIRIHVVNPEHNTFDGVTYSYAMTFDIEFTEEESVMEFIWAARQYSALPYIVKIDYSTDGGVTYENDVTYVRDATQTQYPVLAEFASTTDHMVLQRNDGGSWSNAVSMAL